MKKLIGLFLCAILVLSVFAACGEASDTPAAPADDTGAVAPSGDEGGEGGEGGEVYALVTKSAGNPYNEKEAEGFEAVMDAEGLDYVIQHPATADAEAQIAVIESLISQGVSSIAVAANDANALSSVLQEAKDKGIKICTLDSDVEVSSRLTFCNQAGVVQVAQALVDAVYDLTGGEGDYAILSATSQATNQNAWIAAMKDICEGDAKYANLNLVEVAYGDDENQKSTDQTQALLTKYPDLKVICAPTTVGVSAAAKVVQDQGSSVKVTGLGLPSEMAEFIGDDDAHSCPYMFLWNPIDLGRLAAYTSIALVKGEITGAVGETFTAGDMENSPYTLTAVEGTDASEIILGAPFKFEPSNIEEWAQVY